MLQDKVLGGWGSPEVFPECPVDYSHRSRNQTLEDHWYNSEFIRFHWSQATLCSLFVCFERKHPIFLVPIFPEIFGIGFPSHSSPSQLPSWSGPLGSSILGHRGPGFGLSWPACLPFQDGMTHLKRGLGDKWCLPPSPLFFKVCVLGKGSAWEKINSTVSKAERAQNCHCSLWRCSKNITSFTCFFWFWIPCSTY